MKKLIFLLLFVVALSAGCKTENHDQPVCAVSFDSQGGSKVASQDIRKNDKASKPVDPAKDGAVFMGWYKGITGVAKWNFDDPVLQDMTLYAGWKSAKPADVYIAVNRLYIKERTMSVLKNGIEIYSSDKATSTFAKSVFVSEGDVYVGGGQYEGESGVAKIWKNGTEIFAFRDAFSCVTSVYVSGGDIYACGYKEEWSDAINDMWETGLVWKNGQVIFSTGDSFEGSVNAIWVSGTDVYWCGGATEGVHSTAKVWKNGQEILTDNTDNAYAASVFVANHKVYVSGYKFMGKQYGAMQWVDNVAQPMTTGESYAQAFSVCASGQDVYAVGLERMGADQTVTARMWKNGQGISLVEGVIGSLANCVYSFDGDIYVAGKGGFCGKIWLNGRESFSVGSSDDDCEIVSIFVTR